LLNKKRAGVDARPEMEEQAAHCLNKEIEMMNTFGRDCKEVCYDKHD